MKLGLISDVHGNSFAFKAVLDALEGQVEQILFLGDLAGYYPFVNESAVMCQPCVSVRGNHDEVLLQCLASGSSPSEDYTRRYGSALARSLPALSEKTINLIRSWPEKRSQQFCNLSVGMYHGAPWDPLNGRVYPDFADWSRFDDYEDDIILLGHTHYPFVKQLPGKLVINPGSVGQPRDRSGSACYGILDSATMTARLQRVAYDPRELLRDARQHDPHLPYLAEVLTR